MTKTYAENRIISIDDYLNEREAAAPRKNVDIYTDGACSGNPGPGGWAAVMLYRGHEREISGFEDDTTNNRMELTAAIRALECLKEPCDVTLYSDSAYLVNAFNKKWIVSWEKNNWLVPNKQSPRLNADLWKSLVGLGRLHDIRFVKVPGHADNELNNRCDKLAVAEIANRSKQID